MRTLPFFTVLGPMMLVALGLHAWLRAAAREAEHLSVPLRVLRNEAVRTWTDGRDLLDLDDANRNRPSRPAIAASSAAISPRSRASALLRHLGEIEDPRLPWRVAHPLPEVLRWPAARSAPATTT